MSVAKRAGFAVFGLLLFGFALGVGSDHLWLASRMHRESHQMSHREAYSAMLGDLDLTEEQSEAIDVINQHAHATIEQQVATVHPILYAAMDTARREIEALLGPDQLEAFHRWMRSEHERMQGGETTTVIIGGGH